MQHIRLTTGFGSDTAAWDMNEVQRAARTGFLKAVESGEIKLLQRDACLCGSKSRKIVSLTDRFALPFGSYLCGECGLIYTSPYISPASVGAYYENFYHDLHFGRPASPRALYAEGQGSKVFGLVKDRLRGGEVRALEVGSASGSVIKEFTAAAGENGIEVRGLGLEYDTENVACFNPEGMDIKMRHGGVEVLGREDGPFDIVIMSHVLEHFPNPENELAILKGLLGKGSIVYVEVPGIFSLRRRYKYYNCDYLRYFTGAHTFNFNLYSLSNVMNRAGYSLLWGNEEVESIFAPGDVKLDISGNARLVESYINDIETSLLFYQSLWAENARLTKKVDALMSDMAILKGQADRLRKSLPYRLYKYFKKGKK